MSRYARCNVAGAAAFGAILVALIGCSAVPPSETSDSRQVQRVGQAEMLPAYMGGGITGFRPEDEIKLPYVFVLSLVTPIDESTASYSYIVVNCRPVETRYSWQGVKTPARPDGLSGTVGPMSAKLVHTERAGGRVHEVISKFAFELTGVPGQKSGFQPSAFNPG